MLQEFKKFLIKGNAIDIAIWFVFGAAFANVVKSFVSNVIMPPIGWLLGKVDFSNLFIALSTEHYATLAEAEKAGVPVIKYGVFLTDLTTFIILGFIIFLIVKAINKFKTKEEEKPKTPTVSEEVKLLKEIRDALVQKNG